jgi:hypothetical protein
MKIGSAGSGSIQNELPDPRIVNPAGGASGAPLGGLFEFLRRGSGLRRRKALKNA